MPIDWIIAQSLIPNYNCTGICPNLCVAAAEPVEAKAVRVTRLRLRLRQAQATAAATCIVTIFVTIQTLRVLFREI